MTEVLTAAVERGEEKAASLEAQVERIKLASVDAIAHTQTLNIVPVANQPEGSRYKVAIEAPGGHRIIISDMAHDQFAEKLGIPKPYYQRMLVGQPQLLAENMNTWLRSEPEKRLLRMMKPLDDSDARTFADAGAQFSLRAFLSASYRPLDNSQLIAEVLPVMKQKGAYLSEFSITEQRLHAKFLTVERDVKAVVQQVADRMGLTFEEARARHIIDQQEILSLGVNIRNSETGYAALDVSGLVRILKCTNYYVAQQSTRVTHLGSKKNGNGDGDLQWLSSQTQRLDNAAIFSRVRDTAIALLDETNQFEAVEKIVKAKAQIIEQEEPMFEFIGRIGDTLQLTDGEADILKEEVVRSNVVEGGFTQFSLAQGVTALARQVPSYDRAVELQRAGWEIITDDTAKLLAAGRQTAKRKN